MLQGGHTHEGMVPLPDVWEFSGRGVDALRAGRTMTGIDTATTT